MDSETGIKAAMREVFGKKGHKKLFAVLLSMIIAATAIALIGPQLKLSLPESGKNVFKQEDVAFVSQSDLDFQQKAKNITGYDWTNFLNADGSEKAKTAALLFLSSEISALDDNYDFVNRSVGISKSELPARLNASDTSKKNMLKLIGNIKAVENVFFSKGLESAKIRANRFSVIENFFNRYPLSEGEINSDSVDIFAENLGFSIDDYSRLLSLMIVNYNLFVTE